MKLITFFGQNETLILTVALRSACLVASAAAAAVLGGWVGERGALTVELRNAISVLRRQIA